MSSHLYLISVKRLRIEKSTSEDTDKFEAVADTGRSEKHVIYFPSSNLLSFVHANIVCFRV